MWLTDVQSGVAVPFMTSRSHRLEMVVCCWSKCSLKPQQKPVSPCLSIHPEHLAACTPGLHLPACLGAPDSPPGADTELMVGRCLDVCLAWWVNRTSQTSQKECVCVCVRVCTQVLRLLEDVGLPELVIQLASLAITEAVNDVNSQVTFSTPASEKSGSTQHQFKHFSQSVV